MQIEVDFEVWKALTLRRESEEQSYNDVLRIVLGLANVSSPVLAANPEIASGRIVGGRFLPDGTLLRAGFKGKEYYGQIENGKLIGHDGKTYGSASAAAKAITATSVNGLTFWEMKRPGDLAWLKIGAVPRNRS